jgi:hypothetical protein
MKCTGVHACPLESSVRTLNNFRPLCSLKKLFTRDKIMIYATLLI